MYLLKIFKLIRKEFQVMNEKFEKIKSLIIKKTEKNNKKTIENLVVFVIILIITIIAINTVWKGDKNKNLKDETTLNKIISRTSDNSKEVSSSSDNIEEKLENILSKIEGVGKVKVLITYSSTSMIVPLYNEDSEESLTEENDKEGGTRKITENRNKKDIIYQESSGEKVPITQSVISPKMEGAIITAEGARNVEVKSNIIQAVEAVTGLSAHKIQVFEMKK